MFTLRSFFNWCVAESLCRRNPAIEVQLDRIDHKGRTRFADLELAQRLIENASNDDLRFVLFCGFHTGMRKLEIVEAVHEWFDLRAKTVERSERQRRSARKTAMPARCRSRISLLIFSIAMAFVRLTSSARCSPRETSLPVRLSSRVCRLHESAGCSVDQSACYATFVRLDLREQGRMPENMENRWRKTTRRGNGR